MSTSRKDQNVATTTGLRQNIDISKNIATTLNTSEGKETVLTNRITRTEKPGNMLDLPTDLNNGQHNFGQLSDRVIRKDWGLRSKSKVMPKPQESSETSQSSIQSLGKYVSA